MYKLEFKKIKDIGTVYSGTTPDTKNEVNFSGEINWYTPAEIDSTNIKYLERSERKITEEARRKKNIPLLPKDTVLLTSRAPIGKVAIAANECCTNQGFKNIICDKEKVIPQYLAYWFGTNNKYLNSLGRGATFKEISKKIVEEILIPIPPIQVQHKIVNVLNKCMELKHIRQSQITALDELTKSLFLEMFGDPINNSKKWEVKKLKDVTDKILSGSTPKGGSKVYIENGVTFLRSQNVWKNRLNLDDVVYIDKETHNKMIKSSLMYGDILMTKTGRINTENSSLGRAAIFKGKNDSANINGHVYLIRLQKDIINEFILFILTTDEYKEYIRSVCVGGIDKRQINKEHLEEFPIISPPVELQVQFSKLLTHVEKLKSEMRVSLKELEDTFNSVLQRAFKGELFQD